LGNSIVSGIQQTERDKKIAEQRATQQLFSELDKKYGNQIPDFTNIELEGYGEPTPTVPDFSNVDLEGYGDYPLPPSTQDFTNLDIAGYGELPLDLTVPDFTSSNSTSFDFDVSSYGASLLGVVTGVSKKLSIMSGKVRSIRAVDDILDTFAGLSARART